MAQHVELSFEMPKFHKSTNSCPLPIHLPAGQRKMAQVHRSVLSLRVSWSSTLLLASAWPTLALVRGHLRDEPD